MRKLITNLLLLSLVATVPALARTRAVEHGGSLSAYTASVVDSDTGKPVVGAQVVNQSLSTQTDAQGAFTIPISAAGTTLTISRSGYDSVTVTVHPNVPIAPIALKPRPGVMISTKSGQTVRLDFENVLFIYAQALLTQMQSTTTVVCNNGTPKEIDRADISRISSVVRASGGACCTMDALWFDLELKSGEKAHVALVMDCMTWDSYLGGFEHETYKQTYIRFDDIVEARFP